MLVMRRILGRAESKGPVSASGRKQKEWELIERQHSEQHTRNGVHGENKLTIRLTPATNGIWGRTLGGYDGLLALLFATQEFH